MTKSHGPIQCASCDKVVATISETGLHLPPPTIQVEDCSVCDQVRPLYNAMATADGVYAQLAGRRDTYGPKQSAFANVKSTHREFSNLLARVEKHVETPGVELGAKHAEPGNETQADQKMEEQNSAKRPRSQPSNVMSDSVAPASDVSTNKSTLPKHKRLKFSESVEFREDYRPSDSYARSNEAYIRGRYAAPSGSELLDTSGSDKSFIKFTGMKKVGKKWVDMWKDDSTGDATEDQGLVSGDLDHTTQQNTVSPDPRARTSTGRSSTTDAVVLHESEAVKNEHSESARAWPEHPVYGKAPSRTGRVDTEGSSQHSEKGNPKDLEPRRCQAEMGDNTSRSGVCDPAAGKPNSTRDIVEHALVLGRSPHFRDSSLGHTSTAADQHSPCTTPQAASEDPYSENQALLSHDKRPTADENTTQAPLDATTPSTSFTDLTKPHKDDR